MPITETALVPLMPRDPASGRVLWTEANDTKLRRLRAEGNTWDTIAGALGLSRWTVIERGRKLGVRKPPPEVKPRTDLAREPLPAGHPESWGLLNAGTSLEGAAYPVQVRDRASRGGALRHAGAAHARDGEPPGQ